MVYRILRKLGFLIASVSFCCVGTEDVRGLIFGIIGIAGLLLIVFSSKMLRINYERRKLDRKIAERRAKAIEESNCTCDDCNNACCKAV